MVGLGHCRQLRCERILAYVYRTPVNEVIGRSLPRVFDGDLRCRTGLRIDDSNDRLGIVSTIMNWIRNIGNNSSLNSHISPRLAFRTPAHREDCKQRQNAAYYAQASENPIGEVCRSDSSFQILFGMRLVISVSLCIISIFLAYFGSARRWCVWLGCIGMGLGLLLLLAPIHWEWFLCASQDSGQQDSEYRQTFTHGGNVSQISVLQTGNSETIDSMNFLQREWEEIRPHIKAHVVILVGTAAISAAGVGITRFVQSEIGVSPLPLGFYVILTLLVFCAILLSIILLFVFARFMTKRNVPETPTLAPMPNLEELKAKLFPPRPPDPPRLPDPPKLVDLRGQFLEVYLARLENFVPISTTSYMLIRVKIVNFGNDAVTVAECGVRASIGSFRVDGKALNLIPETWRIKKQKEGFFFPPVYEQIEISPPLSDKYVYKKAIPNEGWLAFEFFLVGDELEFPNAQIDLFLKDSLNNPHTITRPAGVYPKTGELIKVSPLPQIPASTP